MRQLNTNEVAQVSGGLMMADFYYGLSVDNASNSDAPYYGFSTFFGDPKCTLVSPGGVPFWVCTASN